MFGPERHTAPPTSQIGLVFHPDGDRYWREVWALVEGVNGAVLALQRTPETSSDRWTWVGRFIGTVDPRLRALVEEVTEITAAAAELLEEHVARRDEHGASSWGSWGMLWEQTMENVVDACMVTLRRIRRLRTTWNFARDLAMSTLALNEDLLAEAFRLCGGLEELFDVTGRGLVKDTFKAYESATGNEHWWNELAFLVVSVVRIFKTSNMDPIRKTELGKLADSTRAFLK